MGLDVTAYKGLKKLDAVFDAGGEPIDPVTREPLDNVMIAFDNGDFPGRAAGLEDRGVYSYEDAEGFWSGGYGRYNHWREGLAKLAGYPLTEYQGSFGGAQKAHAAACWQGAAGPFSELINFTDCDGTIGPEVAAKLARDFAEWDERAQAIGGEWYEAYAEWRSCFEFAAHTGAVRFH
jgi:hypothetical protein